jgi:hypothetical protein
MLIGQVVVQLSIQIQVDVIGLPIHNVPQAAIWSSVYVDVQEGKVVLCLLLHGEVDVGMGDVQVVKEVLVLFGP